MKNIKFICNALLLCSSFQSIATQGVYEINSACIEVGCFSGDDPNTKTVEISIDSGTFRLSSDLNISPSDQYNAIEISSPLGNSKITIDLNGYGMKHSGIATSSSNGIVVMGNNSIVTIKNGSIESYHDGIQAFVGASVIVKDMVFKNMRDDAVAAPIGIIRNNLFDDNKWGIFATNATASTEGDRLYIEGNLFTSDDASQDPVTGVSNSNYCKDNVIAFSSSNSNFDACTLVGVNLCGSTPCTTNLSVVDEKE